SLIAPRSSFVNPLIAFAGFFVAFLSTLSSVDMRWSPVCRVGQGKRVFPLSNKRRKDFRGSVYHALKRLWGNRVVYFSLNILREHQVGWSSFRLTTGHFSVIENKNSLKFTPHWKAQSMLSLQLPMEGRRK